MPKSCESLCLINFANNGFSKFAYDIGDCVNIPFTFGFLFPSLFNFFNSFCFLQISSPITIALYLRWSMTWKNIVRFLKMSNYGPLHKQVMLELHVCSEVVLVFIRASFAWFNGTFELVQILIKSPSHTFFLHFEIVHIHQKVWWSRWCHSCKLYVLALIMSSITHRKKWNLY